MPMRDFGDRPQAERQVVGELKDGTRSLEVALVGSGIRLTSKTDFGSHFVIVPPHRAEALTELVNQAALLHRVRRTP